MKYGKTDGEVDVEKSVICREIVKKIIDYGVNENQKIKIIKLLAMEIEDRDIMISIINVCKNSKCEETKDKKLLSI